jgi:predicted dehydrogenase
MPAKLTGFLNYERTPEEKGSELAVHDGFTVLLHYENGLTATAKASVFSASNAQLRFWARGERGSYKKCHLDVQEDQLKAGWKPFSKAGSQPGQSADYGVESEDWSGVLTTVDGEGKFVDKTTKNLEPESYVAFYLGVLKGLEGGEPAVTAESSRDTIRLVELAIESDRTGKTVDVV